MNIINHDQEREKELQYLCRQVIEMNPPSYYNPNGADDTTCPFCSGQVLYISDNMSDIIHAPDCAYNIAKDLSTKIK